MAVDIDAGTFALPAPEMPSMADGVNFQALDARRWIVLDRTNLWRTEDGGKTWIKAYDRPDGNGRGTSGGLSFYDADNGFAVLDHKLLMTTDGGRSWATVAEVEVGVKSIFFADASLGWAVGSEEKGVDNEFTGLFEVGRIWKTEDGGRSWKRMNVAPPKELLAAGYHKWELRDIHFVDRSNGWLAGRGTIYRTNDGGRTWAAQPFGSEIDARKIRFIDREIGWVQSVSGVFYATRNGGKSWEPVELPTSISYENSAIVLTAQGEWLYLSEYGRLYRSNDLRGWSEIGEINGEQGTSMERLNGYAYASKTFAGSTVLIWAAYDDGKQQPIKTFVRIEG